MATANEYDVDLVWRRHGQEPQFLTRQEWAYGVLDAMQQAIVAQLAQGSPGLDAVDVKAVRPVAHVIARRIAQKLVAELSTALRTAVAVMHEKSPAEAGKA